MKGSLPEAQNDAAELHAIEACLPRLRRHAALLLGSRRAADVEIEALLRMASPAELRYFAGDELGLLRVFYQQIRAAKRVILIAHDFAEQDRSLMIALHKLTWLDRCMLLLSEIERLDARASSALLGLSITAVAARLPRARELLAAALENRLCIIVEDDLIAMRDLQIQAIQGGLCVVGMAKNQSEAYDLVDSMKPDIGIVDLALPEGSEAGAEIADLLRRRAASRIVFVTAFEKIAAELARPEDKVIGKPWSRSLLRQAIVASSPRSSSDGSTL